MANCMQTLLGDEDSPAPTYLDMLKYNTDVIVSALSKNTQTLKEENIPEQSSYNWLLWLIIGCISDWWLRGDAADAKLDAPITPT